MGRAVAAEKKEKKAKRAKKDPDAPKRALSAYMFFAKVNRTVILAKNPNLSFAEVGKALGEAWRNASADEQEKFNKMSNKDKARYEQELKEYKASN